MVQHRELNLGGKAVWRSKCAEYQSSNGSGDEWPSGGNAVGNPNVCWGDVQAAERATIALMNQKRDLTQGQNRSEIQSASGLEV